MKGLATACIGWLVLALGGLAGPAVAQQMGDESYVPKVAKPAFVGTKPTILFDGAHNNIHTVEGQGNELRRRTYLPFKRLAEADGYAVRTAWARITPKALRDVAILAIVNPAAVPDIPETTPEQMNEPAFCGDEITAIRDFVEAGGALLLIADHYPIGGAASELAAAFGVQMGNGHVEDPAHDDVESDSMLFTGDALGHHPILTGRGETEHVRRVGTFVGQSLVGPAGAETLLRLGSGALEKAPTGDTKAPVGGRAQALALVRGRGRVVVLGEAAMLTSQLSGAEKVRWGGLNNPKLDNEQFALNVLHWLSKLI